MPTQQYPAGMQAEVKDAYWALSGIEDLKTQPGPALVEPAGHRITEMAGRYAATYPAARPAAGPRSSAGSPARPPASPWSGPSWTGHPAAGAA